MTDNTTFFTEQYGEGFGRHTDADDLLHPAQNDAIKGYGATETQYLGFSIPEEGITSVNYLWHHPRLRSVTGGCMAWQGIKPLPLACELIDMRCYMDDAALKSDLHDYTLDNGYRARIIEPFKKFHISSSDLRSQRVEEGIEGELAEHDESEALLRELMNASARGGDGFDRAAFERWLNDHVPDAAELRLTSAREVQGGRSKKTVLLTQSGCASLPEHLVLRSDLNAALTGTTVTSEYELLGRLHAAGIRVPRPLYMNPESAPLGSPFVLMERMPGRPQGDLFNAPTDRDVVLQLAEQLGRLHNLPAAKFVDCKGMRATAVNAAALGAELDILRAHIETHGDGSTIEAKACDWLRAHLGDAEPKLALVHGDAGFHNILIHEGRLSAVLDWELAHIGHPAEDLGYCRSTVEGVMDWSEFVARYRQSGAPRLSDAAIDFYTLWVIVRFYSLAVRVRSGVVSGAVPGLDLTLTSVVFPPNLVRLMVRYLKQFGG